MPDTSSDFAAVTALSRALSADQENEICIFVRATLGLLGSKQVRDLLAEAFAHFVLC